MNLTSGDLYFIRERDVLSGAEFDYYKIGLVKHSRQGDAGARLDEHQTGNPRQLLIVDQVSAPAISEFEKAVHHWFAPHRVLGEWFVLTPGQLADVMSTSRTLAAELDANLATLTAAEELQAAPSAGGTRAATADDLEAARQYVSAKAFADHVKVLRQMTESTVRNAIAAGIELPLYGGYTPTLSRPFDEKKFAESHPELHAEFLVERTTLVQRFTPRASVEGVVADPVSPEFLEFQERVTTALDAVAVDPDAFGELHLRYLELLRHHARVKWDLEFAEARLKQACGTAAGIDGVVTWNRTQQTKSELDKTALRAAHPELYEDFVTEVQSSRFSMVQMRSYPLPTD